MMSNKNNSYEDASATELRRGPWILEEDNLLIQYISSHGEGRWNSLAKCAGLKRTGKSCRLRWLNYLKPDTKRGNLTPHEQLLILELHSKWGNRWSKIAQHLPGRTDNEIKNYWRTRVQKQARQFKVDSNSKKFLEVIRMFLMPRLLEKIEQNSSASLTVSSSPSSSIETQKYSPPSPTLDKVPVPNLKPINSVVNNYDSSAKRCDMISLLEGDGCYHVPLPGYNMQELELQNNLMYGGDMAGLDWFREDLGVTLRNYDDLWQFKKPEDFDLVDARF